MPEGCYRLGTPLAGVRRIIKVLLCNELGLSNNEALTKEHFGRSSDWRLSAYARLRNVIDNLQDKNNLLDWDKFWTDHGGPQFVAPMGCDPGPYLPYQPRRFSWQEKAVFEKVQTDPQALKSRSPCPCQFFMHPYFQGRKHRRRQTFRASARL